MKLITIASLPALLAILLPSCKESAPQVIDDCSAAVIPAPLHLEPGTGYCTVTGVPVWVDPAFDYHAREAAEDFISTLEIVSSQRSRFVRDSSKAVIRFVSLPLATEEYSLSVTPERIIAGASSREGLLHAVHTISQLLPASFFNPETKRISYGIPSCEIKDKPFFSYRGLLIDSGRHFFSADEIKRCLDVMALHKLNRLHWHLTEDQGWRIEIKKYPLLTQIGSVRKESQVGHWRDSLDHKPYGGYYTQDEIRDVVAYADRLGITVIPEIDLPGHMMSALASYPELGCTGGPYEVATTWGVKKDVLCPGKEETFRFLEDVLSEVLELFPSDYINIGGDECPKDRWKDCPHCQERICSLGLTGRDGHTAEQYLQSYVTARIQRFLAERGRKIIGWEEIMQGELAPGATVMSWLGTAAGIRAAENGFDAIMSPGEYMYIDRYQSEEWDVEPVSIGGYLPVEKLWNYNPVEGLPKDAAAHIIGVQANLWTEFIASDDYLEYMLLPRLAALSEVQWLKAEDKDEARFFKALDHSRDIYESMGYTYCKAHWGMIGMPSEERPARTPEELEQYLKTRPAPWAVSKEEGRKLFIVR